MASVDMGIGHATEAPAHMRMKESFERTVGITWTICLGVMLDVNGGPMKRWTLEGHGTKYEQDAFDDGMGLKAAMRQHPVEANGHPETDECVHHCQQDEIGPIVRSLPQQSSCQDRRQERHNNN
jgi:hypothetical protein